MHICITIFFSYFFFFEQRELKDLFVAFVSAQRRKLTIITISQSDKLPELVGQMNRLCMKIEEII